MVGHFASESAGEFRHGMTDGSEPDDTPFAAVQLSGGTVVVEEPRRGGVFALFDETVVIDDFAQHGYRASERGFRNGVGGVSFGIFHGNTACGGGLHVDVVHPGGRFADEPEFRQVADDVCRKFHLVHNQNIGIRRTFENLFRCGEFVAGVVTQSPDAVQVRIVQTVFVQKNYIRHNESFVFCYLNSPIRSRITTDAQQQPKTAGM